MTYEEKAIIDEALRAHFSYPPDYNTIRRARSAFKRCLADPGDCRGDLPMLAGLAVAEAVVGRRPGWIPEVQRIGCVIAQKIESQLVAKATGEQ